jgi:DHA1 family multidrug resistance protein-like MFS transporter
MFSGVVGASRALVASSVPRDKVPYAMGLIQSAIFMGQTLGPTIGGILGSTIGFRASFVSTAAINVMAGTLAVFFVKEQPVPVSTGRQGRGKGGLREMLRSRSLALLFAMFFLTSVGNMMSRPILSLLLEELDPETDAAFIAGLAFSVLGVSGAIASVASSRSGGRFGLRGLVVGACVLAGVSTCLIAFEYSSTAILATLFFTGLAQGTLASSSTALISLFAPANRQGTAFGMLTSAQSLAMGTGPIAGGALAYVTDLRMPFTASGMLLMAGALLVLAVPAPPVVTDAEVVAT